MEWRWGWCRDFERRHEEADSIESSTINHTHWDPLIGKTVRDVPRQNMHDTSKATSGLELVIFRNGLMPGI
jgi:hypothetical protein